MPMTAKREKVEVPDEFLTLFKDNLEKNNLTLVEVAEKTGLSQSYLSRILSGERGLPPDDMILLLGKTLKINPPEALLVSAGRVPVTKGSTDLRKIEQSANKINELSAKMDEVKEAAKDNLLIAKILLGISALVGVVLVLLTVWARTKKAEGENE